MDLNSYQQKHIFHQQLLLVIQIEISIKIRILSMPCYSYFNQSAITGGTELASICSNSCALKGDVTDQTILHTDILHLLQDPEAHTTKETTSPTDAILDTALLATPELRVNTAVGPTPRHADVSSLVDLVCRPSVQLHAKLR